MRLNRLFLSAAVAALIATPALAEPLSYSFDKVHTQVHASVSHLGFSNSTARFHVKDGSFTFDPADLANAKVDVTIAADSIDLGDKTWKDHLSGAKWFDFAGFPEIRFVSTKVEPGAGKSFKIHGELTLKGVTQPVTLDATLNGNGPHPFSKKPAAGFSATASFKRSDFGMAEYVPAVGDEVTVRIEVEGSAG
ncbi:MAG: YceI family protein [Xanthomonadales bacterium]|nr:YceI family protein [Xanthomonadales bacterium]